eukprot:364380-Chlamydomonas_euryale.AAC.7
MSYSVASHGTPNCRDGLESRLSLADTTPVRGECGKRGHAGPRAGQTKRPRLTIRRRICQPCRADLQVRGLGPVARPTPFVLGAWGPCLLLKTSPLAVARHEIIFAVRCQHPSDAKLTAHDSPVWPAAAKVRVPGGSREVSGRQDCRQHRQAFNHPRKQHT